MLSWAVKNCDCPVAIRYPRGGDQGYDLSAWADQYGQEGGVCCHRTGKDVTIVTYGIMLKNAMDAAQILHEQGVEATVLRLLTVEPLPAEQVISDSSENPYVVILEDVSGQSGIGDTLARYIYEKRPGSRVDTINFGRQYVTHGSLEKLCEYYGLDGKSVARHILEVRNCEN